MPAQAFWQGVEQFNQRQFYECHDTLEALWMEAPAAQRNFYQGVLQIAVACYHLGNHNWRGAVILLGEGIKRLRDYQPDYEEIDVAKLVGESSQLLTKLQNSDPKEVAQFIKQLEANQTPNEEQLRQSQEIDCRIPIIIRLKTKA